MYRLPVALRATLARPLAPVLDTQGALSFVRGKLLVAVGDVVTQTFLDHGIVPRLMVVDGVTQRSQKTHGALLGLPEEGVRFVEVESAPATVSQGLWDAVRAALESAAEEATLIRVIGEEDLAALPALIFAPDGAVVCYGQPNEGVVCVPVTPESRARAQSLIDQMEVE